MAPVHLPTGLYIERTSVANVNNASDKGLYRTTTSWYGESDLPPFFGNCSVPAPVDGARRSNQTGTLHYRCEDGYRWTGGSLSRVCQNDTWSGTEPVCVYIGTHVPTAEVTGTIIAILGVLLLIILPMDFVRFHRKRMRSRQLRQKRVWGYDLGRPTPFFPKSLAFNQTMQAVIYTGLPFHRELSGTLSKKTNKKGSKKVVKKKPAQFSKRTIQAQSNDILTVYRELSSKKRKSSTGLSDRQYADAPQYVYENAPGANAAAGLKRQSSTSDMDVGTSEPIGGALGRRRSSKRSSVMPVAIISPSVPDFSVDNDNDWRKSVARQKRRSKRLSDPLSILGEIPDVAISYPTHSRALPPLPAHAQLTAQSLNEQQLRYVFDNPI